ncbi:hypothetical protein [uncultured Pseudokineococcus sp.]|uniref:hypothetical protein n=1 Tax=uncultured Pseudokineococcus sp. TaxID=1642928 RepID=UPI0026376CDB|nr:hypothetical protein [uncultured Pseudokineococcus sp.]
MDVVAPPQGPPGPALRSLPAPSEALPRRSGRGRGWAVAALVTGLVAVLVAALGALVPFALLPAPLAGLLGTVALATAVVALVRSRTLDVVLLAAASAACTATAGLLSVAALLLPLGLSAADDPVRAAGATPTAERIPDDVLAGFRADALPLGHRTTLDGQQVAVVAVLTERAEVDVRLAGLRQLADEVAGLEDVALVELEAPVDGGGWAPLVDSGGVALVTPDGDPYGPLSTGGYLGYEVDTPVELDRSGLPRGRVVIAFSLPPELVRGSTVVVLSPAWTDVATWAVP